MQNETDIALANLDWLMVHRGMRLDYAARAVVYSDGSAGYLLDDLAVVGLTPATEHWDGRLSLAICTEAATSSPARVVRKPHYHRTEGTMDHVELTEDKPRGYADTGDWQVRSPALPPEERG